MDFPISGVHIEPIYLVLTGFVVGVLGGFFGVGGSFIAGPLMFIFGVPMNYVIGTDLAHITGKSIIAARRHRALGHVDIRLAFVMVPATMVGVETGAQLVQALKSNKTLDTVIGVLYIIILILIAWLVTVESLRALRRVKTENMTAAQAREAIGFTGVARRFQSIRLRPMIALPASGIPAISLWVVLIGAFISGFLGGLLGGGAGYIRLPTLIYVIGVPTHLAIGTDLLEVVFSAGYGTLTHTLKGNVDIMIALVMHTGAAIGAQIGVAATRYIGGPKIRLAFASLPVVGAILVALRLLGLVGAV
ncbi:MAG: sulfite exporter TauE/SafE family protein [Chloroflexi bacterium]|nr:sulfite exporter TauE/SafE family protein [Chloroflexota bacterium]